MQNEQYVFHWENTEEPCEEITPVPVMVYITPQKFEGLYPSEIGIDRGTIFEALDKPFKGGDC